MTKWEYCFVIWAVRTLEEVVPELASLEENGKLAIAREGSSIFAKSGLLRVCGSSEPVENITDLHDKMAELGLDGWELVSHTDLISHSGHQAFYFKRPIEE